jgi:hypothetical protein
MLNINMKQEISLNKGNEYISIIEYFQEQYDKQSKRINYDVAMEELKKYKVSFIQKYESKSIVDLLNISLNQIISAKIVILRCKNCKKFFIPKSKENEKYCDNIFKNRKTCKQLSYEIKLQNSDVDKLYRTSYKTQNAKKKRYSHIKDIQSRYEIWNEGAKKQLELCRNANITKDEFKEWLKNNSNWHLNK